MSEANFNAVRFIPMDDKEFGATVKRRVRDYFKSNEISRLGDYRIWLKVILLPMLYLVPFGFLMTNSFFESTLLFYGLWILMGFGMAGIGLGVMHDACHGAISKKKWVNDLIGTVSLGLAGGHALNWKIQHNVLHHSYTNIDGHDEDIDPSGVMRFSPHQPVKKFYKYQIVYAWFLYGLMTFSWTTFKDFVQLSRYKRKGLLKSQGTTYKKEIGKVILGKLIYYTIFMALPIIFIDIAWWQVVLAWFVMHFVAGLTLACIFQPAHVVPTSEFPLPDDNHVVEGDWIKHQMMTTSNFAPTNRLLSWYVGGLNYQVEHHLFPNMSHVHHREVSKIVEETAREYDVPYNSNPTFRGALMDHAKLLHRLSK